MKKLFLIMIALLLVSCIPQPNAADNGQKPPAPPTPPPEEEEEPKNPLIGYWVGRNEYMRFRENGTFQLTLVHFGGNMTTYEGEWSMTEDGKLNASYSRRSGTLDITTNVAHNATLYWAGENEFDFPGASGGYYYLTRLE